MVGRSVLAQNVLLDRKRHLPEMKILRRRHPMAKEIMTIEEAARYLQIGKRSLYNLVKSGKIPGKKVLNKWRFEKESLRTWVGEKGAES